MRPRCCLRYFTFLGINIGVSYSLFLSPSDGGAAGDSPSGLLSWVLSCGLSCFHAGCTGAAMGGRMACRAISPGACCVTPAPSGAKACGRGGRSRLSRSRSRSGRGARLGLITQPASLCTGKDLALVDPALDADHAIGGICLAESEVDIGAQGVQ